MKQVRLLPVVIAAGLALLLFKGAGIMSGGGYVLTGTTVAVAAGGGAPAAGSVAALAIPAEPTMTDSAPMLDDSAPTIAAAADGGHGAGSAGHSSGAEAAETISDYADVTVGMPDPTGTASDADPVCPDGNQSEVFTNPGGCGPPMNAAGQAIPMTTDAAGRPIPLSEASGIAGSEGAILERLSERREALDTREAELEMRLALVEAAERRIEERTAALQALEARIDAMVDEKRTLEEAQFTSVVAMYETMKPKDAAAIFDQLEMGVLLRVARAVNPRKMAPIMARMNPLRARDLTSALAVDQVELTIDMAGEDLSALPQIIGQ